MPLQTVGSQSRSGEGMSRPACSRQVLLRRIYGDQRSDRIGLADLSAKGARDATFLPRTACPQWIVPGAASIDEAGIAASSVLAPPTLVARFV
jgi:hypothetical protein